eukprot:11221170-Lingulodinium_polyedra.AAC.1
MEAFAAIGHRFWSRAKDHPPAGLGHGQADRWPELSYHQLVRLRAAACVAVRAILARARACAGG